MVRRILLPHRVNSYITVKKALDGQAASA